MFSAAIRWRENSWTVWRGQGAILQAKGYATLEAVNGIDGVRQALEHRPDLVLMDIQLPDINGIEAFGRIRANADTASIPIVAFTASVMSNDRSRITDAGFDGFIGKPINLKEFLVTVARVIEGQGA
ncbi:MAG TPA: response regulator [Burkholderiaceae bacterium]|nr:response regulator [Burkholderiaceae bacterium]